MAFQPRQHGIEVDLSPASASLTRPSASIGDQAHPLGSAHVQAAAVLGVKAGPQRRGGLPEKPCHGRCPMPVLSGHELAVFVPPRFGGAGCSPVHLGKRVNTRREAGSTPPMDEVGRQGPAHAWGCPMLPGSFQAPPVLPGYARPHVRRRCELPRQGNDQQAGFDPGGPDTDHGRPRRHTRLGSSLDLSRKSPGRLQRPARRRGSR